MDTSRQVPEAITAKSESTSAVQRQRRNIAEKRRIVEETLVEGASVARIARAHGVNANQVFGWRRLYLSGRLGQQKATMKLLPVRVSESLSQVTTDASDAGSASIEVAPAAARRSPLSRPPLCSRTTLTSKNACLSWTARTSTGRRGRNSTGFRKAASRKIHTPVLWCDGSSPTTTPTR